jgi:hypothetical protein
LRLGTPAWQHDTAPYRISRSALVSEYAIAAPEWQHTPTTSPGVRCKAVNRSVLAAQQKLDRSKGPGSDPNARRE